MNHTGHTDHKECQCGQVNHISREKCLNCDKKL